MVLVLDSKEAERSSDVTDPIFCDNSTNNNVLEKGGKVIFHECMQETLTRKKKTSDSH